MSGKRMSVLIERVEREEKGLTVPGDGLATDIRTRK